MPLQLARADVAYAAIHRRAITSADALLEYFVFRELGVAATLGRNFLCVGWGACSCPVDHGSPAYICN